MTANNVTELADPKLEHYDEHTVISTDERLLALAKASPPFYKNHNLLKLYLLFIPTCLTLAYSEGFDGSMMNGLQSVPAWDSYFDKPRGATLGLMGAMPALGAVLATPFISPVGDKFGRRAGIFVGSLIMVIGGVLQSASVHIAMFIIARFCLGFGMGFVNVYGPVMLGELSHPNERQIFTSLFQTTWYIGSLAAAWITFGTYNIDSNWSWRIPSILQILGPAIQIFAVWFLPESPRWLLATGQREAAKEVLIKWHANGNREDEFVQLEYQEINAVITLEMDTKTTWKTLVATAGNRRRMAVLVLLGVASQWSGNGLISYYLTRVLETVGIQSAREQNIINGSLQIWVWFTAIGSAIATLYLPRKTQFRAAIVGTLIVFSAQTLCAGLFNERGNTAAGNASIAMLFLFYVAYNLGFNALLYAYPVELLPYPIRAKGFAVLIFFGKSANFVNTFVNPIGMAAMGWKYYFVYVAWLVVEVVAIFLLIVETKGPSLEGIAAMFDGAPVIVSEELVSSEKESNLQEKL
ncbi:hypothetical protein BP6252_05665 [Coleophoma cylindrospora]|uniref:Major facilitator superfamily (MFS) profile domain-containing protein n=1 Tax=Coleophoma cylindrospora TaxID=1849047 RepID=A0A3D8RU39_9HELO|nr:hypothetical protein BP6252_05665 [Coleophoma cylindrospora]